MKDRSLFEKQSRLAEEYVLGQIEQAIRDHPNLEAVHDELVLAGEEAAQGRASLMALRDTYSYHTASLTNEQRRFAVDYARTQVRKRKMTHRNKMLIFFGLLALSYAATGLIILAIIEVFK